MTDSYKPSLAYRVKEWVESLAILTMTTVVIVVALNVNRTVGKTSDAIEQQGASLSAFTSKAGTAIGDLSAHANTVLDNVNGGVTDLRVGIRKLYPVEDSAKGSIDALTAFTKATSTSVNDSVLPQATATLGTLKASISDADVSIKKFSPLLDSVHKSTSNLAVATGALAKQTPPILAKANELVGHANGATIQFEGIMTDLRKYADKLVAPERWSMKVLHAVWNGLKTAFYARGALGL